MRELIIDKTVINDNSDCFVIAEIGHNHQGEVETAKKLFIKAKEANVNAVKLQKRSNIDLFTHSMYNSSYENKNSYGPIYGLHREALEFGVNEYKELKEFANDLGLIFFATPFDFKSVDLVFNYDSYLIDLKEIDTLKMLTKNNARDSFNYLYNIVICLMPYRC